MCSDRSRNIDYGFIIVSVILNVIGVIINDGCGMKIFYAPAIFLVFLDVSVI